MLPLVVAIVVALLFRNRAKLRRRASGAGPDAPALPSLPSACESVLRELAMTEGQYVRDLVVLSGLANEVPEVPMGNIQALLLLHTELAKTLGVRVDADRQGVPSPPSAVAVAKAFTTLAPFLRACAPPLARARDGA